MESAVSSLFSQSEHSTDTGAVKEDTEQADDHTCPICLSDLDNRMALYLVHSFKVSFSAVIALRSYSL